MDGPKTAFVCVMPGERMFAAAIVPSFEEPVNEADVNSGYRHRRVVYDDGHGGWMRAWRRRRRGKGVENKEEVMRLLRAFSGGDRAALDRLLPVVYDELRKLAHARLRDERSDHTLNTTALVHEAYLELIDLGPIDWQSRAHFFGLAAQVMRHVLVDYAVRRKALKRGGGMQRISLDEAADIAEQRADELLALEEALQRLEKVEPRQSRVVECRFFGGLSIEETAHVLGVSPVTVTRDWTVARAWLNRELGGPAVGAAPSR